MKLGHLECWHDGQGLYTEVSVWLELFGSGPLGEGKEATGAEVREDTVVGAGPGEGEGAGEGVGEGAGAGAGYEEGG